MQSYIHNGIANQADLDAIRIDQLKAQQNRIQLVNTRKAYIDMLSQLIDEPLNSDSKFVTPEPIRPGTQQNNRPELTLFDAQIRALDVQKKEINSGLMPKFGLFVTGGYGRPGLNMLEDRFAAYYIGGIKLSWNIGNFYTKKNRHNKLQTSMHTITTQRDTFLFNTALNTKQIDNTINSYFEQLRYDDEIITLHRAVKQASEAKMANGTLSGTDLMRDIHAEQMALQDKTRHQMELLLAIYNLKFTTNN